MTGIPRRSILKATGALSMLSMAHGSAFAQAGSAAPRRGGKLIMRRSSAWTTFDAHVATNVDPEYPLVFDYLTRYERSPKGTFEVVPGLAQSWKVVDDNTIEFALQRNVVFHDGTTFGAKEVAWNIERMLSHPKSTAKVNLAGLSAVDVVDTHTVRMRMSRPNAALLVNLSSAADGLTAMLSMEHVKKVGDEQAALRPVGTGPFEFLSWVPNQKTLYARNAKYWQEARDKGRLPYLDQVESILQSNDQTAILRLRSGSFHLMDQVPGSQVEALKRVANVTVVPTPWRASIFALAFNARPGGKFAGVDAKKVRQAVFAAIDKKAVAHAAGHGLGHPAFTPLVSGQVGYSDAVDKHAYDPAKARRLLTEAGVRDRMTINMAVISRQDDNVVAQLYQQMLSKVGIDLVLQPQDRVAWASRIRSGDFELASFFTRGRPDADGTLSSFFGEKGGVNYAGLKDAPIEDLLAQGRSTYDAAKRHAIYERVQNEAHARCFYDFIWRREGVTVISNKVAGYVPPFSGTTSDGMTTSLLA